MNKIFLVEDDPVISKAVVNHLTMWGYEIKAAVDFGRVLGNFWPLILSWSCWISGFHITTDITGARKFAGVPRCRWYFSPPPRTI